MPGPGAPRGRSASSQEAVRQHNLGRLLRRLHMQGAMSRADLTAGTGLNRSTVKALTADLVAAGLVIAVIINGMLLLNRSSAVVFMVTGVVLLVAASVDALSRKRAAATGRG